MYRPNRSQLSVQRQFFAGQPADVGTDVSRPIEEERVRNGATERRGRGRSRAFDRGADTERWREHRASTCGEAVHGLHRIGRLELALLGTLAKQDCLSEVIRAHVEDTIDRDEPFNRRAPGRRWWIVTPS